MHDEGTQPEQAGAGEWLELAAPAEPEAVDAVAEAFGRWGQGVAIEQPVESSPDGDLVVLPEDAPLLVKTYVPLRDPRAAERREQIERAVWALGQLRRVGPLSVRTLREEEWANAWKAHFVVHRVGRRTVIVPSWRHDEYEPRADDVVLLLDPGMAFGTGLHPTTRLCLRALEDHLRPGTHVLDLGSGSGILAIAAARLGAGRVDAVEIDPVAAAVCRANVTRNGVADRVAVAEGALEATAAAAARYGLAVANARYGLAVANITIRVLLEERDRLAGQLAPGAPALLSGVLAERADELVAAYRAAGWTHERTDQEQDWVAVTLLAPAD